MATIRGLIALLILLLPATVLGQDTTLRYRSEAFSMNGGKSLVIEQLLLNDSIGARVVEITDVATGISVRGVAGGPLQATLRDGGAHTVCFLITQAQGAAPPEVVGETYCYLFTPVEDTFTMVDFDGHVVGPILRRILRMMPETSGA